MTGNVLELAQDHWQNHGFSYGQVIKLGFLALWTVASVNGRELTLSGPAIPDGTMIGATLKGFATSPLVVFGSTSQDGVWYSGDPSVQSVRDFGSKPFPSTLGNGHPHFVFPVANAFRYFGNNVIDASGLYAGAPSAEVPSFGITMYGGAGDDTLIGSRARDFIFGGGGIDSIQGQNAVNGDLVNYDDGVNVDVITRALAFPTWNQSVYANADPLRREHGLLPLVFSVPWQLSSIVNGVTSVLPTIPGITAAPGTTPPPVPWITLDPRDRSDTTATEWITNLSHPRFLAVPGLLSALPYFADGNIGANAKFYLDGVLYTEEELADGVYTLTGTITDYYGMKSSIATGTKLVRVDSTAPDSECGGLLDLTACCDALDLVCSADTLSLYNLAMLLAPNAHTPPDSGSLAGLATSVGQILVPGGLATSGLMYGDELGVWVDPIAAAIQDGTAPVLAPLQQLITVTGVIPVPQPINMLTLVVSLVDENAYVQDLRNTVEDTFEALTGIPLPIFLATELLPIALPPPAALGDLDLVLIGAPLPPLVPPILAPLDPILDPLLPPILNPFPTLLDPLAPILGPIGPILDPLNPLLDPLAPILGPLGPLPLVPEILAPVPAPPPPLALPGILEPILDPIAPVLGAATPGLDVITDPLPGLLAPVIAPVAPITDPALAPLNMIVAAATPIDPAPTPIISPLDPLPLLDPIVTPIVGAGDPIVPPLAPITDPLAPLVTTTTGALTTTTDSVLGVLGDGSTAAPLVPLPDTLTTLAPVAAPVISTGTTVATTLDTTLAPVTSTATTLVGTTSTTLTSVAPTGATLTDTAATTTTTLATTAGTTATAAIDPLIITATSLVPTATTTTSSVVAPLTSTLATVGSSVDSTATTLATSTNTATTSVPATLTSTVDTVTSTAVTTAPTVVQPVTTTVATTTSTVTSTVTTAVTTTTATVTPVVATTTTTVQTTTAPLVTTVTTTTAPITSTVTKILKLW